MREQPMESVQADVPATPQEKAWKDLATIADAELWIAAHDQELQQHVTKSYSSGHGICLTLAAGGLIYLHTTGDGDVVLDVTDDAAWTAPVITAATGAPAPVSQIWVLSGDKLTQLILGLNSLVSSSRIVLNHRFRGMR